MHPNRKRKITPGNLFKNGNSHEAKEAGVETEEETELRRKPLQRNEMLA